MKKQKSKYIFVVGGVMSGIGKGVTASSIGTVLEHHGYRVNLMKVDPYLNVDAGTMSPTEHGEVFVLDSGLETDQDMGNYERFLDRDLSPDDYLTSGMVYQAVISRERSFGYGGECVEAIPHVVDEIRSRIERSARQSRAEAQVVEIGGTLGDYQNPLFLEAARQMAIDADGDVIFVLVSYLPCPDSLGEVKTRPTQNAIRLLNSYGISPSIIVARSESPIDAKRREKISRSCNLPKDHIVSAPDVESIYDVPVHFDRANMGPILIKELSLSKRKVSGILSGWRRMGRSIRSEGNAPARIAIVGKYFETGKSVLADSYISVIEAIRFSCVKAGVRPEIAWLSPKKFEGARADKQLATLDQHDGILIPGGFGSRGAEGKIAVIQHARKQGIPLLGICYGLHLMVVERARNVAGKRSAHTAEINPKTQHPVIAIMEDQREKLAEKRYGGSMRLGAYTARIQEGSLLRSLYGSGKAVERHRHRYEVNDAYIDLLEEHGLHVSARSDTGLAEAVEARPKDHPFFVGTQYHPEFTARPFSPNPVFTGFVRAAKKRRRARDAAEDA